jgi:hypothetical protein
MRLHFDDYISSTHCKAIKLLLAKNLCEGRIGRTDYHIMPCENGRYQATIVYKETRTIGKGPELFQEKYVFNII